MQPVKVLLALLLCAIPASAAYVQSGKQSFANGRSTVTCSPGSVTAGDVIVMAAYFNTPTPLNPITSTRVTTWVQDQHVTNAPNNVYLFHGVATSSGTETITVSLSSGTTFAGSACAEYSNPVLNVTSLANVNTTVAVTDIVCVSYQAIGGSFSFNAPFTTRQQVDSGTDIWMILGDRSVTSAGTYIASSTPGNIGTLYDAFAPSGGTTTFRHRLLYQ